MDMPNPTLPATAPRRLIILNSLGDVEISWDPESDEAMRAVIARKMEQGFCFYTIDGNGDAATRTRMKTIADLHRNRIHIDDEDITTLFADGKVALTRRGSNEKIMQAKPQRVREAEVAAKTSTVAVAPMQGARMIAPDIQYFLDGCVELNQMAPDTHEFFYRHTTDTNEFIDGLDKPSPQAGGSRKQRHNLEWMALACEARMLREVGGDDDLRLALARATYDHFSASVEHFVENYASMFVDSGFCGVTDLALGRADLRFGLRHSVSVMKRAATRCHAAMHGYDPILVERSLRASDRLFDRWQGQQTQALAAERRRLGVNETDIQEAAGERKRTLAYMRGQARKDRRVIKRSVKLAEGFLGSETTRLFISREKLRIEGRLATYELVMSRGVLGQHGGTTLSVWTREGDIRLCNLCLYSNVPVLDHVIGVVMKIKAGEEEEILSTGNAYDIVEAAYENDWLVPYLPKRYIGKDGKAVRLPVALLEDPRYIRLSNPERRERLARMRPKVTAFLMDEIGRVAPPMPTTLAYLLTGRDRQSDRIGVALGQIDGIPVRALDPEHIRFSDQIDIASVDHIEGMYAEA